MYVFFRSRTLGYDVYPEDFFLPNFPWQQYGGLWVCDEARFARSEPINVLNAQALRRLTGEGIPIRTSQENSPTSSFTRGEFDHVTAANDHVRDEAHGQLPTFVPSWDRLAMQCTDNAPVSNMASFDGLQPKPEIARPNLSLLTDVGRRYPGFPTPLSPTLSARETFPSPASEVGSNISTRGAMTPTSQDFDAMSIDGSEMCGFSRRYESHRYTRCLSPMGLIDNVISCSNNANDLHSPPHSIWGSPRSPSISPQSPVSPPRAISPRTAMLKSMIDKQAFQGLSHNPTICPPPGLEFHPKAKNLSFQTPDSQYSSRPYIHISNGTETSATSPISPTGTVLVYTSHRPVTSGLLGVRPLSEEQVAEYRFWRPCGKRGCAFGCGSAQEGEWGAAKRLFRGVETVSGKMEEKWPPTAPKAFESKGGDGSQKEESIAQCDGTSDKEYRPSAWAGRRMVTNWNHFLANCEREDALR